MLPSYIKFWKVHKFENLVFPKRQEAGKSMVGSVLECYNTKHTSCCCIYNMPKAAEKIMTK